MIRFLTRLFLLLSFVSISVQSFASQHSDFIKKILEDYASGNLSDREFNAYILNGATVFGPGAVDPNITNDLGQGILHLAAQNGNLPLLSYFLGLGHNGMINRLDSSGSGPIHYAVQHAVETGKTECITILLAHGANINLSDREDVSTPLHYAVGNIPVFEFLMENGASPLIQDSTGFTLSDLNPIELLCMAVRKGDFIAVRVLLSAIPEIIEERDEAGEGHTPLFYATRLPKDPNHLVDFLIQTGEAAHHHNLVDPNLLIAAAPMEFLNQFETDSDEDELLGELNSLTSNDSQNPPSEPEEESMSSSQPTLEIDEDAVLEELFNNLVIEEEIIIDASSENAVSEVPAPAVNASLASSVWNYIPDMASVVNGLNSASTWIGSFFYRVPYFDQDTANAYYFSRRALAWLHGLTFPAPVRQRIVFFLMHLQQIEK